MTKLLAISQLYRIRNYLLTIKYGGTPKISAIQSIELAILQIKLIKEQKHQL